MAAAGAAAVKFPILFHSDFCACRLIGVATLGRIRVSGRKHRGGLGEAGKPGARIARMDKQRHSTPRSARSSGLSARARSCGWAREAAVEIEVISTGSLGLDIALGIGGLPRGRIVEIYGPESSGKTTLALHVVAEAQKARRHLRLHRCRARARSRLCPQARRQYRRAADLASPMPASRRSRSPTRWCARAPSTCWWSTASPRWCRGPSWKARWATAMSACMPG